MLRRALAVGIVVVVMGPASMDLSACGDKFVRVGRGARAKGYAAIHPASILIYKPNGTAKGLKIFESQLKKAGHKPVALMDGAALSRALGSAKFDVVIADYADASMLEQQFRAASLEPGLLPILHQSTDAQETEVRKHYHCIITPERMTPYEALEEIDHLMQLRAARTAAAIPK
jgi:CheY-like chemotaxis protein